MAPAPNGGNPFATATRWGLWGCVAFALVAGVYYLRLPKPLEVSTVLVDRALIERTVANTRVGTVKACERSRLSPAIGGQVAKLYVKEGQQVAKDQLLLELWNEDRKARLQKDKATVVFARRERQRVCITAESDKREARRLNRLLALKLASEEEADQAQSRADASSVACESAAAKQDEADAAVAVARASLEQTYLKAPFAGIVAEVTGEVGEYTTPSPPGVATPPAIDLLTNDCHYISAPIDEVDAALVKVGMPVRITLDAYKGQVFAGLVRRVGAYVQEFEKQARTVDVEVTFDETAKSVKPADLIAGYSADIEVILATKADALRIPTEALLSDGQVFTLEGDLVVANVVQTGLSNWRHTEVVSGLAEGAEVIIALGRQDIVPGATAVSKSAVSKSAVSESAVSESAVNKSAVNKSAVPNLTATNKPADDEAGESTSESLP